MLRLRENYRVPALVHLATGVCLSDVERQFNCHRYTVINLSVFSNLRTSEMPIDQPGLKYRLQVKIGTFRQSIYVTGLKTTTSTGIESGHI